MGKKWRVDNLLSKVGGGIYSRRCCSVDISYLFIVVLVFYKLLNAIKKKYCHQIHEYIQGRLYSLG